MSIMYLHIKKRNIFNTLKKTRTFLPITIYHDGDSRQILTIEVSPPYTKDR